MKTLISQGSGEQGSRYDLPSTIVFHMLLFTVKKWSYMSLCCVEAVLYHILFHVSCIASHVSYHAVFFAPLQISLSIAEKSLKVYTTPRDQMPNPSDIAKHDNPERV